MCECVCLCVFVCELLYLMEAGEGTGTPLQYSCLENPIDREAQEATVHELAKESQHI